MIVVLDTNVIISALLSPSNIPRQILNAVIDGRLYMAFSPHMKDELDRALQYDKVKNRLLRHWSEVDLLLFIEALEMLALPVENMSPSENWISEDPDDNWVIQCAISAHASHIITGDRLLLLLGSVSAIDIISPAAFLKEINH